MNAKLSASGFARRAREAGHDALGLGRDLDSTVALAALARREFAASPSQKTLQLWQALLEEVIQKHQASEEALESAAALEAWLAREIIRLNVGRKSAGLAPEHVDHANWLAPADREAHARAFEMQLVQSGKALER